MSAIQTQSLRKPRRRVAVELALAVVAMLLSLAALWRWAAVPASALMAALAVLSLVSALVLQRWRPAHAGAGFGAANRVTLLRAVLVSLIAGGLVAPGWIAGHAGSYCALILLALALDGVDGAVARRTGTASDFGAAFDMELDALFVLVLSLACWLVDRAGVWVLAIGLMRYAMLAAAALWPRLRGAVPSSFFAKAVCVLQIAALCLALTPWTPARLLAPMLLLALALLTVSFGRDVVFLLGRRQPASRP